jgi:hypothetical protein
VPLGYAVSHRFELTGAHFVPVDRTYSSNVIYAGVFERFVRFNFHDPPIWERLDEPASLYISGSAEGELTGAVFAFRRGRRVRVLWCHRGR